MKKYFSRLRLLILCGLLLLSACLLPELITGPVRGRQVAFAVDTEKAVTEKTEPEKETEAKISLGDKPEAIVGMMDGIGAMENYDKYGRVLYMQADAGSYLAGARGVNRYALNRYAARKSVARASSLGYDALTKIAENQMSYSEYYTLLQIVEAEATGGDEESKLLIANVVLNRVKDTRFPDTVYDVVWQRQDGSAQFSPTADGRIYSCEITKSTCSAVARALAGEDNSKGALFFLARDYSEKKNVEWFDANLKPLFSYGGHEFFTYP